LVREDRKLPGDRGDAVNGSSEAIDYWRQLLAGVPARLELPGEQAGHDSPRLPQTSCGQVLDAALVKQIQSLAGGYGATWTDIAMLLWAAMLARVANQDSVVLGVAHDAQPGSPTLPLRLDVSAHTDLAALLAQWQAQRRLGRAHATVMMADLASLLAGDGTPAEACFQFGFRPESGTSGQHGTCELWLLLDDSGGDVRAHVLDQRSRLDASMPDRLLGYWYQLLRAWADRHALPLAQLPLLDAEQSRHALAIGNDTTTVFPPVPAVHCLFEAQVVRTPDALALVQDGRALSYAQLNAQANRLAQHLRTLGVGVDDRVAIYAERGIEMVVGLLSVLKAGAAYVPLDPTYPAERLAYTLQDSAPAVLLTQSGMENDWQQVLGTLPAQLPVLDIGEAAPVWQDLPTEDLSPHPRRARRPRRAGDRPPREARSGAARRHDARRGRLRSVPPAEGRP
jgi:non-ribosomal peptide synthetase component F